jgi:hypothetical protein
MAFPVWKLNGFEVRSDGRVYSDGTVVGSINVSSSQTATITGSLTVEASGNVTFSTQEVVMDSLPTSDPSIAGQLWNNAGIVNVSSG